MSIKIGSKFTLNGSAPSNVVVDCTKGKAYIALGVGKEPDGWATSLLPKDKDIFFRDDVGDNCMVFLECVTEVTG